MGYSTGTFLDHLEKERRYSGHTLTAYETDLKQFTSYLTEQYAEPDPLRAGSSVIRSWLAALVGEGYSRASINRKMSALKSFYQYFVKTGRLKGDPTDQLRSLKKDRRLPEFVQEEGMQQLFGQGFFGADFAGLRDLLLMELLYTTGMRLSEMTGLRHGDVDESAPSLRVTGKRNKDRVIPLLPHVVKTYRVYCEEKARLFGGAADAYVIVTNKGKKCYPEFVYRRVNFYLRQVTTRSKKSPHVLRHSFATHMLDHGADLNAIKEILGHSSLAATQVYTHNTIEKIKSIYKQAHPKA